MERFLGKKIFSVSFTDGISATDGSIVDKLDKPEVMTLVVMNFVCTLLLGYLLSLMFDGSFCARRCTLMCGLVGMQFACLHVEYKKDLSAGTAADPSAEIMAYHYCLLNRMAPESRLASSPCFGVVVIGCLIW